MQGAEIFNVVLDQFKEYEIGSIRFSMYDLLYTPECLMFVMDPESENKDSRNRSAEFNLFIDGDQKIIAITPKPKSTVQVDRYPYDEDAVLQHCNLHDNRIEIDGVSPYSFIETIVAMNKYMHQMFFPDAHGKWIFTRLDLSRYVKDQSGLTLRFQHNFNFKLTKSYILLHGEKLGEIYFSLLTS